MQSKKYKQMVLFFSLNAYKYMHELYKKVCKGLTTYRLYV